MVSAGVVGIFNFAPKDLKVPEGVAVRNERLAVGIMSLSFKVKCLLQQQAADARASARCSPLLRTKKKPASLMGAGFFFLIRFRSYQRMRLAPQVKPLPKATVTTDGLLRAPLPLGLGQGDGDGTGGGVAILRDVAEDPLGGEPMRWPTASVMRWLA